MSEMGIELIVEAFAVVVIGGLGSMRGAFPGRPGGGRAASSVAISVYPELEMLLTLPDRDRRGPASGARRGLFGASPGVNLRNAVITRGGRRRDP